MCNFSFWNNSCCGNNFSKSNYYSNYNQKTNKKTANNKQQPWCIKQDTTPKKESNCHAISFFGNDCKTDSQAGNKYCQSKTNCLSGFLKCISNLFCKKPCQDKQQKETEPIQDEPIKPDEKQKETPNIPTQEDLSEDEIVEEIIHDCKPVPVIDTTNN